MKIEKHYLRNKRKKANPDLEPKIRIRIQTKGGAISRLYTHFVYDKTTGKRFNRSVTFGKTRTREEAYKVIMKWRRAKIKEVNKKARLLLNK